MLAGKADKKPQDGRIVMSQERKPERVRDEKINGVIYDMSPAPAYQHSQVIGQIFAKIKNGLKGSMCLVFMENIDYSIPGTTMIISNRTSSSAVTEALSGEIPITVRPNSWRRP